jgi:hypothetical protein
MKLLRTAELRMAAINRPGGWANDLDHGVVGALVEQLAGGVTLPPIKVRHDGWLVAGRHRLAAHERLKLETIRADVVQYDSPEEAEADGLCENLRRRNLTVEERDRQLARLAQLYRTVGMAVASQGGMAQRESQSDSPTAAAKHGMTRRGAIERVAKDANVSPSTVARAVAKQETAPAIRQPEPPPEPCVRCWGLEVPAEVLADAEAAQVIIDEADLRLRRLQATLGKLTALGHFPGGKGKELRKAAHDLARLVRQARPAAFCAWCAGTGGGCKTCKDSLLMLEGQMTGIPDELQREGEDKMVCAGPGKFVPLEGLNGAAF